MGLVTASARSLPLSGGSCYTPGALTGQTGAYFALFSEIGILLLVTTLCGALAGHWLVFEEPPAGYRFRNDMPTGASTGHEWAAATLAQPVRVLISGDSLHVGGHA